MKKITKHGSTMYISANQLIPYNEVHENQTTWKYYLDGVLQAIINKNETRARKSSGRSML